MQFQAFFAVAILSVLSLVSGCGGGSDTGSSAGTPTTINSLAVTSSTAGPNQQPIISPGLDNGSFNVGWSVSASDPYHVSLYISVDAVLSPSADIQFFQRNCGSQSTLYQCSSTGNFACRFTNQNTLACGTSTLLDTSVNITALLDAIPKAAHVIAQACNGLFTDCKTAAVLVQLQ